MKQNFYLPAEWEEQSGVQLTWPHAGTDWAHMLKEVQSCFREIAKEISKREKLLIVAHGNSLRGIIKYLKRIPDNEIVRLNLPTAVPYVFEFDHHLNLTKDYFLGDPDEIRRKTAAVANQGTK